jgi:hypothetical protein
MEPQSIVIWLLIGAIAGFLAGLVMEGGGFGLIGNICNRNSRSDCRGLSLPASWRVHPYPRSVNQEHHRVHDRRDRSALHYWPRPAMTA